MATEVIARAKWIRMSAPKAREAAQLIKGKPVDEARRILAFTPKASARAVSKVLESAIANAEHNFQIPQEELVVKVASADEGVTIKRFRPRAQGRGYRIRKRTCHIHLTLERVPEAAGADTRPRRPRPSTEPATAQRADAGQGARPGPRGREGPAKSKRTRETAPQFDASPADGGEEGA